MAISDYNGKIASPIGTLKYTRNRGDKELIQDIKNIVKTNRIKTILMGIPQAFIQSHEKAQNLILEFTDKLKETVQLPILFQDESFSTTQAQNMLLSLGQKSRKSRSKIDKVSAAHFLQQFLDQREQENELQQTPSED